MCSIKYLLECIGTTGGAVHDELNHDVQPKHDVHADQSSSADSVAVCDI